MKEKEFLVLLRGGDDCRADLTENQNADHIQKWNIFLNNLAQNGYLLGGLPLQPNGRLVTLDGVSKEVVLSESGEAVSGYLIFKAKDYKHAVELVANCPIFEYNGNAEIREMVQIEM